MCMARSGSGHCRCSAHGCSNSVLSSISDVLRRSLPQAAAAVASTVTAAVCLVASLSSAPYVARDGEWREYGGDPGGKKYSSLDQINAANIDDVQVAWTWASPDREIQALDPLMRSTRNEDTPLMV